MRRKLNILWIFLIGILILGSGCLQQYEKAAPTTIKSSPTVKEKKTTTTTTLPPETTLKATLPATISTSSTTSSTTTTFQETTTTIQKVKEISMTARQFSFEPSVIEVNKGDKVKLQITSTDVTHGISLPVFGINKRLPPGRTVEVEFTADRTGTFSFACSVYCGSGHGRMKGKLIVK